MTTAAAALVVALTGISGVHEGATPAQVASHWRVPIHFAWVGEHPALGLAPICGRGVAGSATFGGPGDFPDFYFRSAWFFRGAHTDRGVAIGARFARVRKAYGNGLRRAEPGVYTVESAVPPRTVIVFRFVAGRVAAIGWGYKQALAGNAFAAPGGVHC